VVPSETLVITAGVFAASIGEPNIVLVAAFAAVGAFIGDHISYAIGRFGGTRLRNRLSGGSVDKAFDWADKALTSRGASILLVARYIPGGRTAATVTCGTVRFPLRTFSLYDSLAAISWGIYSAGIGYIGGEAFEENPLVGLAVGLGIALGIAGIIELVRARREKSRKAAAGVTEGTAADDADEATHTS
jgi:membrane-associated protein